MNALYQSYIINSKKLKELFGFIHLNSFEVNEPISAADFVNKLAMRLKEKSVNYSGF